MYARRADFGLPSEVVKRRRVGTPILNRYNHPLMWYVYILRSLKDGNLYIGFTNNLERRIDEHKKGKNISTSKRLPVRLESYIAVPTKEQAMEIERYFKTGSDRDILRKKILR